MGFLSRWLGRGIRPPQAGAPPPSTTQPLSERYLFSLVEGIQTKEREQGFDSLASAEKVFFCVWTLEAEVNNGGFNQFYFNSSGDIAADVPNALRTIGAGHTAAIVARANGVFGAGGPPTNWDARQKRLGALDDAANEDLEALDQEFLKYHDDLSQLLANYMKSAAHDV